MFSLNSFHFKSKNTKNLIYYFSVISLVWFNCCNSQNVLCPKSLADIADLCSRVKCLSSISDTRNCPEGTYHQENITMCKCCPGCAKYFRGGLSGQGGKPNDIWGEVCFPQELNIEAEYENCDAQICPVKMNACEPGFECIKNDANSEYRCRIPMHEVECAEFEEPPCIAHAPPSDPKVSCQYKKVLFAHGDFHWNPVCDEQGGYTPRQCKGIPGTYDGECFCVDAEGERIFGRQWWAEAENQTCACSRMVSNMRSSAGGSNIATLHCSTDGNYEPVQCDTDSGTCFCVDPKTGKTTGGILPQDEWKSLPCYAVNLTNPETVDNYLRACDSEMAGRVGLNKESNIHGTYVEMKQVFCDYDGSFSPLQNDGTTMTCTHKNGDRILDYFKGGYDELMDCTCARDEVYYKAANRPFPFAGRCQGQTGNYDSIYDFGSMSSCIDLDGFPQGANEVPSTHVCCLLFQCSVELGLECLANGYIPCKDLLYDR